MATSRRTAGGSRRADSSASSSRDDRTGGSDDRGSGRGFRAGARRLGAMSLACALATSGLALGTAGTASAAPGDGAGQVATGSDWRTSFEDADTQPLASTPLTEPVNVTGSTGYAPGSLAPYVTDVTASAENPPGETAVALTDDNPASKWLAFEPRGTITYLLDGPHPLATYSLTSGNDAPERDPRSFTVQGSTDGGATWTVLDTQTDVAFAGRQSVNTYQLDAPGEYDAYRLDITQNRGAGLTQLADWTLNDGSQAVPPSGPMATEVGGGPVTGLTAKPSMGFSGTKSLRYAGEHTADGPASATNVLYDDLDLEIGTDSVFSYKIFPELGGDLQYPATHAAVDLQLDDGTLVSSVDGIVDGHGEDVSAAGQGAAKILYADHWNSVRVPLGDLAGRTVERVVLSYDNAGGADATRFQGWVDDLDLDPAPAASGGDELVESVDTRRGTNSTGSFSRGNNIPAAAVPNGFNFWTPMTAASSQSWLYDWSRGNDAQNLPRLQGVGISHEPSPWMGDRNQLALLPSTTAVPAGGTDAPDASLTARALQFDHGDELARPDLYSVRTTSGLETAVTPTDHGAVLRFGFPEGEESEDGEDGTRAGSVLVDRVAGASGLTVSPDGVVSGWVENGSGLSTGASRMFAWGQFDRTPTSVGAAAGDRDGASYASFDATRASGGAAEGVVELRLATSFISLDQARHNAELELADRSFEQVRQAASDAWEERLGVVEVQGATDDQVATLYGSLYRLNLYPNSQFENTGTAAAPVHRYASPVAPKQGEATATTTNAQVEDGEIYVNNGFWDTYRTVWPAYSLLYPDVAEDLVDGFVQMERDSGWIARWSSPGYADLMTGTSSDVAFADAYVKGALSTELALEAYDAGLKNASVQPTQSGVGRKGLDQSLFLGYTPESTHESVSWALEGYINDFGLGRMAAELAEDPATPDERRAQLREESAWLLDRAEDYPYLFDPEVGFFQARDADGTFATPAAEYDPEDWGGAYTETNGWNFAFHAPFDVAGLASLYGGSEGLDAKLAEFYATPEEADKPGGYGGVIHEMLEARDVRMGQLGMSNQVSHHIPYISAANGDPATTQAVVREITQRLFVGSDIGQGYPGDEDNGEMSSWYLFSALGFYPLAMGTSDYTIGSPLFDEATLHLPGGDFTITAEGNSVDAVHVQSATLDGRAIDTVALSHDDVASGGQLTFQMGEQPSDWAAHAPEAVEVPTPLVDATRPGQGVLTSSDGTVTGTLADDSARSSVTFDDPEAQVTWQSASGPVAVERYTLTNGPDGSAAPTAWRLEGSSDGTTWTTLDERTGQAFPSSLQTRAFTVPEPTPLGWYRISTTGTTDGRAATLSELELLVDPEAAAGDLAIAPRPDLTAEVGTSFEGTVATVTGASGTDELTATVDWLDGEGPQAATLAPAPLGGVEVVAPEHLLERTGAQPVVVTAIDGDARVSTTATVIVSRTAQTVEGAFDNVCLGDPGQAANCDFLQNGLSRTSLAEDGFVQGGTVAVPGTELDFDLPAIPAGEPDNATGDGQVLPLYLGDDVTQLSVIGTATERGQQTVGTLTFDDGSTQPLPIEFGDWTGAAAAPAYGNLLVATSAFRTVGASGTAATPAAVYATAPVALPEGKRAVSLTLPVQTGDPRAAGRIHVFAVATDGTRLAAPAPLAVTAGAALTGTAGEELGGTLATIDGEAREGVTATVAWGDGTALETVPVEGGAVAGSHVYALEGEYAVTVTVDDGRSSAATTTTATVAAAPVWTPTITVADDQEVPAGGTASVTGTGFAPGEQVEVTAALGTAGGDVVATAIADGTGAIAATLTVPVGTAGGTYPVTAVGAVSQTAASGELQVAVATVPEPEPGPGPGPGEPGQPGPGEPGGPGQPGSGEPGAPGQPGWSPELRVLVDAAPRGTVVPVDGSGFAPGETVTLTLFSDPVALGSLTADASGVLRGSFTVPAEAVTGAHEVEALGSTSQTAVRAAFRVVDVAPADQGVAPVRPGSNDGSLAWTGGRTQPPLDGALLAGVLLASGLALTGLGVGAHRRRRALGTPLDGAAAE